MFLGGAGRLLRGGAGGALCWDCLKPQPEQCPLGPETPRSGPIGPCQASPPRHPLPRSIFPENLTLSLVAALLPLQTMWY